jgi:hypothetical protein
MVMTTDEEIDAALERARHSPDLPGAISACYNADLDAIAIELAGGRRLLLPRKELQGLETASAEQLSEIEIYGGFGISWPQLDVDHYLPSLLAGQYGSNRWMKQLERRGIPDTPNNSGHAIAKRKAAYALYPLGAPFSHAEGLELLGVRQICEDGATRLLAFLFDSGSFVVTAVAVTGSIDLTFEKDGISGEHVTNDSPWSSFVGLSAAGSWLAVDQQGYLNCLLLAFGDSAVPQVAIVMTKVGLTVRTLTASTAKN